MTYEVDAAACPSADEVFDEAEWVGKVENLQVSMKKSRCQWRSVAGLAELGPAGLGSTGLGPTGSFL